MNRSSMSESMFLYVNTINPLTCACGKSCPFLSYFKGYQQHCSNRCAQKDPTIILKHQHTSLDRYGTPSLIEHNRTKRNATMIKRYGVLSYTLTPQFKQQSRDTNIRKRGVLHHMQDYTSFKNSQRSQFRIKTHITADGGIFSCQGYEPHVLDWLVRVGVPSSDITTNISSIPYIWRGKNRRYFPDLYISTYNVMIEVKSRYYWVRDQELNIEKQKATQSAGFLHTIIVVDSKGTICDMIGDSLPFIDQNGMI